jgi:hypothetical protein
MGLFQQPVQVRPAAHKCRLSGNPLPDGAAHAPSLAVARSVHAIYLALWRADGRANRAQEWSWHPPVKDNGNLGHDILVMFALLRTSVKRNDGLGKFINESLLVLWYGSADGFPKL